MRLIATVVLGISMLAGTVSAQPRPEPAQPDRPRFDVGAALAPVPGGLTADAAAQRAIASAPSVERAEAAAAVAEAGAARAWLSVYPRVDLTARYTRLSEVSSGGFGSTDPALIELARARTAMVMDPAARDVLSGLVEAQAGLSNFSFDPVPNQFALRAEVSYPVSDLFLTILPAYRASQRFAEAQQLAVEAERQTVGQRARDTFYGYLRARGALAVAQSAVTQAESRRAQVAALVDAGTAARVELMRVDAQIARARVAVARAEAGVALSATALRTLLHLPPEAPIELGEALDTPVDAPAANVSELVALARRNRIELRALRAVVDARGLARDARSGARWPHLAVAAGVDLANPNSRVFPQQQEWDATWDASVVLRWSPNDAFSTDRDVAVADAELAQARADVAALEDGVRLEVTQALADFQSAAAAYEAATVGLVAAEESYRVRTEQLDAGVAVTSDLIDAEADLTRARLDILDASIDLRLSRARLRRAVGE